MSARLNGRPFDYADLPRLDACALCGTEAAVVHVERHDECGDWYDERNPLGTRGPWWQVMAWCESCDTITETICAWHKGDVRRGQGWVA
jgi:hypothetical protein